MSLLSPLLVAVHACDGARAASNVELQAPRRDDIQHRPLRELLVSRAHALAVVNPGHCKPSNVLLGCCLAGSWQGEHFADAARAGTAYSRSEFPLSAHGCSGGISCLETLGLQELLV